MSTATPGSERQAQRDKQIQQAEEILATVPQEQGVAKGLFWGDFVADWIFPYPQIPAAQQPEVDAAVAEVTRFCEDELDPVRIDREATIPPEVIARLRDLGVLGMTAPKENGGRGFSQMGYGRVLEVLGGHCSSTSLFVNAHHSIGMRALILFGTEEQQRRWLPGLVGGETLAAFALTEPEAGSDAANVQTTAVPSDDGTHFILNGEKRYITNGSIADVLTVMARTPVPGTDKTAITAFFVTPDMPGFEVTEAKMEKLGVRGSTTSRLAFHEMKVPRENILGPQGQGLKVALTVLNFGRTTFGAVCTGTAKTCLRLATEYAKQRTQFDRTLAEFELVQQKLARMAAWTYAMDAMTTVTAGLIDRGLEDYMLETAMLKVYSTERLWTIVNDAFQIFGGAAYFTDLPLERMLRDNRINQIGEGANDVLISFTALTGIRGPALRLKDVSDAVQKPWSGLGTIGKFAADRASARLGTPHVPVRSAHLEPHARRLGKLIRRFGNAVQKTLITHREEIIERQLVQERITWAAMELFATACVLSRWDHEGGGADNHVAALFVTESLADAERWLDALGSNNDQTLLAAAQAVIG